MAALERSVEDWCGYSPQEKGARAGGGVADLAAMGRVLRTLSPG